MSLLDSYITYKRNIVKNYGFVNHEINLNLCVGAGLPAVLPALHQLSPQVLQGGGRGRHAARSSKVYPRGNIVGAVSTKHSSSNLRVIGTIAHEVDFYFLHLAMRT